MLRLTLATSAALAFSISATAAAPAVGLVGDKPLVMFDTDTLAVSGTMDGKAAIEDFNPAADKLRYMSRTTNHRVDVDSGAVTVDGSLAYEDGTLAAIGKFGFDGSGAYAFDVQTTSDMKNTAWLVNQNTLYTIDLETGKADSKGMIEGASGEIRDITILPKM